MFPRGYDGIYLIFKEPSRTRIYKGMRTFSIFKRIRITFQSSTSIYIFKLFFNYKQDKWLSEFPPCLRLFSIWKIPRDLFCLEKKLLKMCKVILSFKSDFSCTKYCFSLYQCHLPHLKNCSSNMYTYKVMIFRFFLPLL